MKRNAKVSPVAYSGKYIDYKDVTYFLMPEKSQGCCRGCDMLNVNGCSKELTDYCRQGYVFKRIK